MTYRKQLTSALDYAVEHDTFNKARVVERAENVCCFGLGTYFNEAFVSKGLKERWHINLLSDNNPDKHGKYFEGLPCVPPAELADYKNLAVIILLGDPRPIQEQLNAMGIYNVTHVDLSIDDELGLTKKPAEFAASREKYLQAFNLMADDESKRVFANAVTNRIAPKLSKLKYEEFYSDGEYFDMPFMKWGGGGYEVFVDCGAWIGDTVKLFAEAVGNNYKKIHAFELDADNFTKMKDNVTNMKNVVLHNAGVWNENKEIAYGAGTGDNEPSSGISIAKAATNETTRKAKVVKLDDALNGEEVTFIKMDIEGAEVSALLGATNILKTQKPKLAVCVYHKTSDFWEVPLTIYEANPNYKFYMRHHLHYNCWGTVLYAV